MFAWSRVTSIAAYYLVWAGLGAVMAAVLYEPAFAVVTRWFARRRARALLTITLVAGMASTTFLPLTEALVARLGWRSALAALSLFLGLVTIPLHALVLRRDPRDLGQQPDGGPKAPPSVDHVAWERASASVALLGAAFVLAAITTAAVGAHMVPFLVERGFAGGTAAALAGAVGLMQLPGRLLHPVLERRLPPGRVTPVLFAALALALLLLSLAHGLAMALAAAGILGMTNGLMTLARATEVADRCGVGDYGRMSDLLAFGTTLARAAGPIGAAWLLAGLGGYGRVFTLLGGLSAVAALLALVAAGSDPPERTWVGESGRGRELELVGANRPAGESAADEIDALGDGPSVPQGAILLAGGVQRHVGDDREHDHRADGRDPGNASGWATPPTCRPPRRGRSWA